MPLTRRVDTQKERVQTWSSKCRRGDLSRLHSCITTYCGQQLFAHKRGLCTTSWDRCRQRKKGEVVVNNDYKELVRHSLWQTLLLSLWILAGWTTDKFLLSHFPLEGMSLISFRLFEVALHLSALRILLRVVIGPKPGGRWPF